MIINQPEIKIVSKSWGFERWIVNKELYCGKELFFIKNKKCSFHYHKLKDETFYIQSGRIIVLWSDQDEPITDLVLFQKILDEHIKMQGRQYRDAGFDPFVPITSKILTPGDNFYVPAGRKHQMFALEDTSLFEFSTQHSDDDSYRIIKGD